MLSDLGFGHLPLVQEISVYFDKLNINSDRWNTGLAAIQVVVETMWCDTTGSCKNKRLHRYMKSRDELLLDKISIEEENGEPCKILTANEDCIVANANNTSGRNAPNGLTWIDYWRAMAEEYDTMLHCSSCGKVIFVGEVPKLMKLMYQQTGDTPEAHRAIGGHIWIQGGESFSGGRYITPMCPECNAQRGEKIRIRKDSIVCKEITLD